MSVITVSLSDQAEKTLRQLANEEYAGKKGAISRILEQGIEAYLEKKKSQQAKERAMARMKVGLELGGGPYYHDRGELYD